MTPFSPRARARTAAESVTMEKTISDARATSRGESAQSMPRCSRGAAFCLVRFQPVTVWPAANKRGTIAWPCRQGQEIQLSRSTSLRCEKQERHLMEIVSKADRIMLIYLCSAAEPRDRQQTHKRKSGRLDIYIVVRYIRRAPEPRAGPTRNGQTSSTGNHRVP